MNSQLNKQKIITNLSELEKIYLKKDYRVNEKPNYERFDLTSKELTQVASDIISENIQQMENNNEFLSNNNQDINQEAEKLLDNNEVPSQNYQEQKEST